MKQMAEGNWDELSTFYLIKITNLWKIITKTNNVNIIIVIFQGNKEEL